MICATLLVCLLATVPATAQDVYLLVITGVEGDAQHGELFHRWATKLIDAAKQKDAVPDTRIVYLAEKLERDKARISGRSTRETVEKTLAGLAQRARPDDQVFIVLFGHGSFDGSESRFNLPGPDLTAPDYARLLKPFQSNVVFANTTSSSGEFIAALSGPRRTIVTATRNGDERNEPRFPEFFVEAFTDDTADLDKNGRASILEAFNFARARVARTYEQDGLIVTEHPLIDDNGDGKGTSDPVPGGPDGRVASLLFLGVPADARVAPRGASADPALQALYEERRELERKLDALKLSKDVMTPEQYAQQLEKVLTEIALKGRTIRELEGTKR